MLFSREGLTILLKSAARTRLRKILHVASLVAISVLAVELSSAVLCALSYQWLHSKSRLSGPGVPHPLDKPWPGFLYVPRKNYLLPYLKSDSLLDVVLRPGLATRDPYLELKENLIVGPGGWVKNNSDIADNEEIREDDFVIWMSGGSTVFGEGLGRNEDTVPSQLEAWLRARAAKEGVPRPERIRVINGGVPSYNTAQELKAFLFDISFRRPRIWVQLNGVNESWHYGKLSGSRELNRNKYLEGFKKSSLRIHFPVLPATQTLFTYWAQRLSGYRAQKSPMFDMKVEQPELVGRASERYFELVKQGRAAAATIGADYAYFLQPTQAVDRRMPLPAEIERRSQWFTRRQWKWVRDWANEFYGEMRGLLGKRGGERGLYDASAVFDGIGGEELYLDSRHYNPAGGRILAAWMGERLWLNHVKPALRAERKR